jgi:hypothetical protein
MKEVELKHQYMTGDIIMPIDLKKIKEEASSLSTFQKGQAYQRGKRVILIKNRDADNQDIQAVVRGSGGTRYHVSVHMDKEENVLDAECDCPAFESYSGFCKHIVATLLENNEQDPRQMIALQPIRISAQNTEEKQKDRTDPQVIELMRKYAQRSAAQVITALPEELAHLEPTLIFGYQYPRLSFKIGAKRLYILKDITKFISDMGIGAQIEYGKQFKFVHHLENFEQDSRPLAQYILQQYHESDNNYYKYYAYYGSPDIKKYMVLTPFMLDSFMKLCVGRQIKVEYEYKEGSAVVRDENPSLTAALVRTRQGGFQVKVDPQIRLLSGADRLYVFLNGVFYCCNQAYSEACSDFLSIISQKKGQLSFSEENMKAFVSTVLSEIRPFIRIDSEVELSNYEPFPLVTKVYLDRLSSGMITARMAFCYGDEEHAAFQPKKVSESTDLKGELYAEGVLKKYFTAEEDSSTDFLTVSGEDEVYDLVSFGMDEISSFAEVYATDAFKDIRVRPVASSSVGVRLHSGLLEIEFGLEDFESAELMELLHSYRKSKKYHRLRDGSFVNLENDSISKLSELMDGLNLSDKDILKGKVSVPKSRALYLDELMKRDEAIKYERDGEFRRIIRDMKDVSDSDFPVPLQLDPILRNYQKNGYRWLRTIASHGFGGILADDMGLGKTLQSIVYMASNINKEEPVHNLIVCPTSLIYNWQDEIENFAPYLKTIVITGAPSERQDNISNFKDYDVLITSYPLIRRDITFYEKIEFHTVFIDEAQFIKNDSSLNAKSVKRLRAKHHFALTGTPIENSLSELWSIFDFIMPDYLGSHTKFVETYEKPIMKEDTEVLKELHQHIEPFILRRMKKDVLKELPDKYETKMLTELSEGQKLVYLSFLDSIRNEIHTEIEANGVEKSRMKILAALTRLRQICCHPSTFIDNYQGGSGKLELLMEVIPEAIANDHRILVFSQFTSMLRIIEDELSP